MSEKPEKMSILAAQQELVAIQKVLELQRAESYKMQEHIVMLDGEVDALKEVVHKKQQEINRLAEIAQEKSRKIDNLNENIKSLRVDNGAIQIFSNQNLVLLKKYEESEKNLEESRKSASNAVEELAHYKKIYDEKSRAVGELEVSIRSTERELSNKLTAEEERNKILESELKLWKEKTQALEMELYFVKETSRDQIMRSRQSEYSNLLKSDTLSIDLHRAEDMKEKLSQSLNLESFRANLLHDRLQTALETLDESQTTLHAVVQKSDETYGISRVQERRLRKENKAVSQRLHDAQEVIKILTQRCWDLEQYMLDKSGHESDTFFASQGEVLRAGAALETSLTDDGTQGVLIEKIGLDQNVVDNNNEMYNSLSSQSLVENVTQRANPQYLGKRCLMAKHMRNVVMLHNSLSIPDSVRSNILDFSRCAITDNDMIQLVDWMRLMTLSHLRTIDFRSNLISTQGLLTFCAYILALGGEEFRRDSPISVLFHFNKISPSNTAAVIDYLNSAPRSEIKLIVSENGDRSIGIYGNRRTSQRVASAVFRFELFNDSISDRNTANKELSKSSKVHTILAPGKSKRGLSKTVGHVNAVQELRQNSASYSVKMSTSLSGESAASQLRKDRSLNI